MKNISDLRKELTALYQDIKNDRCQISKASELNNTIGKLLVSYKLELDYNKARDARPEIRFLDSKTPAAKKAPRKKRKPVK